MANSAVWEVQVAVVAALEADAGILVLLGGDNGIFDSRAPLGRALPYIIVSDNTEHAFDTFSTKGLSGTLAGKSYAIDKPQCLDLYRRIKAVLDRKVLVLTGGLVQVFGRVELITVGLEEDAMRAVWNYRTAVQ